MRIFKSSIVIVLIMLFSSCSIMKRQNNYLKNLRATNLTGVVRLSQDVRFKQVRGKIKTEYYALAGKGDYKLVFESDSGFYFYAFDPKFECEDNDTGGLFLTKEDEPKLFLWTNILIDEEKFGKKVSDPKYVKRLKWVSNPNKPFVHWYYEVPSEKYKALFGNH